MCLPYDEKLGIYAQDEGFLDKSRWPYPAHTRPLLLDYHLLTLNRYKICKQGDVAMTLVLAGDEIDLQKTAAALIITKPLPLTIPHGAEVD